MKQDVVQMTLKKRLSLTAATMTVATVGLALVSTLVSAQANGVSPAGGGITASETAPPPGPFSGEKSSGGSSSGLAPKKTDNNYPPADFDPEKTTAGAPESAQGTKGAGKKQKPKVQHQWPSANQNATSSKEYPPQSGIDLTPPAKAPLAKPELKYPPFPSAAPSVVWSKKKADSPEKSKVSPLAPKAVSDTAKQAAPATSAPVVSGNQSAPKFAPLPAPATQWAPPPQPWGQPVWQPPGAYQAPGVGQAPGLGQAETDKTVKDRQAAMKRQWENQQAEMKRAQAAHDAMIKKQMAEMEAEIAAERKAMEAEMLRQRKMMEAEMVRQRKAMEAEIAIMRQQAKTPPIPPLPPKVSQPDAPKAAPQYVTPQQVAPQQVAPQQVVPQQVPQWAVPQWQYQNRGQYQNQRQYQNRGYPAWRYNPYWRGPNRQWQQRPRPYYGPGYYQPRYRAPLARPR